MELDQLRNLQERLVKVQDGQSKLAKTMQVCDDRELRRRFPLMCRDISDSCGMMLEILEHLDPRLKEPSTP
jgi:hypothetical protein